jgi:hypothetical protein
MANNTTKAIGTLKVGDKVESADPSTGKDKGARTVQHIWINHDTDLLDVTISDGRGHTSVIHTTANHPFWDDTTHTWVRADHLKAGHKLASTHNQHPAVINTKVTPGAAYRWNLTVQQLHTYYVVAGGVPILVHNSNGKRCDVSFTNRQDALNAAYDRAGLPRGKAPDAQWEVGSDYTRIGTQGYRFDDSLGAAGTYMQFETEEGSIVIAEHVSDIPNLPHFHVGVPKIDPTRNFVNFGWDMGSEFERYGALGGKHHIYYLPEGTVGAG